MPPTTSRRREQWPGRPYPVGATWDGTGTDCSTLSSVAARVEPATCSAGVCRCCRAVPSERRDQLEEAAGVELPKRSLVVLRSVA